MFLTIGLFSRSQSSINAIINKDATSIDRTGQVRCQAWFIRLEATTLIEFSAGYLFVRKMHLRYFQQYFYTF